MRPLRIGMASIDTTVGAFSSNTNLAIQEAVKMAGAKCDIGLFQEQTIPGYPMEDLTQWRSFVEGQWRELGRFCKATSTFDTVFVIGLTIVLDRTDTGKLYNVAAVVYKGRVYGLVPKELLPTYNVFYESRTFARGRAGLFLAKRMDESVEVSLEEADGTIPFGDLIFRANGYTFAVEVCEDIWSADGPMRRRAYNGAELILNLSASPHRAGVQATRREMIATRASDNAVIVAYVSQVGGNDGLVFDGASFVNVCGTPEYEGARWKPGLHIVNVDLDRVTRARTENTTRRGNSDSFLANQEESERVHEVVVPVRSAFHKGFGSFLGRKSHFLPEESHATKRSDRDEYLSDLLEGAIMGLDGYFRKTKAFERVGVALSGGRDSGLTAVIARIWVDRLCANESEEVRVAIRRELLTFITMPSRFSSDQTRGLAHNIAKELGATFHVWPIEDAFMRESREMCTLLDVTDLPALTKQNIQARLRGMRMWNWANACKGMWLQTGNMSETATGYTTIGGDLMGAYSLIGNIPKTVVIHLLRYIAREYGFKTIATQAEIISSAELASGQSDEKDLMPFEILDSCYALFAGEKLSPREVYMRLCDTWSFEELRALDPDYKSGQLKEWVRKFCKLFMTSVFKWVQKPLGVHHGSLDLDRERALQIPVVTSREWLDLDHAFDDLPDV